uniref:Alkaline phosphatase n=1 Tax=Phlebotomus kandelakii TaxID=1109342 RepID=A0A6B2E4V7_9DIPT
MFAQMLRKGAVYNLLFIVLFTTIEAKVFPKPPDITEDSDYWVRLSESHLRRKLSSARTGDQNLAKNVIIFVGDGMGMPTITAGRIYKGQKSSQSGEENQLSFDVFPNIGLAKTYNTDKQVPDSAGTATSLFTGIKTRYGYVGVDSTSSYANPSSGKLSSIMDWAQASGKRTGLVTTTRVTHATPAALYAHSPNRDWECDTAIPDGLTSTAFKDIARQLVEEAPGKRLNVILGGGREMMGVKEKLYDVNQIKMNGSFEQLCPRKDGRNLAEEWLKDDSGKSAKQFVKNTGQLLAVNTEKVDYLLGLFAQNHIPYNLVREKGASGPPSLAQMTSQALKVLQRPHSAGFVLMVEGGRIDHGHHQNYAHIALEEFAELDAAVETALNLTDPKDTLIIVTADHSHAMIFNGYANRGNDILEFGNKASVEPYETLTYANGPGFLYHRLNKSQEDQGKDNTWTRVEMMSSTDREDPFYRHLSTFPLMDSTHAGEDVPVYATGPGSHLIYGVFEQNYIAHVVGFATCMGPTKHLNEDCHKYKLFFQSNSAPNTLRPLTVLSVILTLALAALLW